MVTNLKKSLSPSSYVSSLRISFFSGQCSSQIPQQHTSTQQSYGSTSIASTTGEQEAEYKSKENQLPLQQCCKSEESVTSDKFKQCNSLDENTEKNLQDNTILSLCTAKVVVDQQGVVHVMLLTFPVVAHVIHL